MSSMRDLMRIAEGRGNNLTLFHTSPASLTQFNPLSHFGSREAAIHRARNAVYAGQTMRLYEVAFSTSNPLRVRDLTSKSRSANHNWSNITDMLHYTIKKLSADERDSIYAAAAPSGTNNAAGLGKLVEVLHQHGWDALTYKNVYEDAGSVSWINLTSEQVRIISVSPVHESTH